MKFFARRAFSRSLFVFALLPTAVHADWLLHPTARKTTVDRGASPHEIAMTNGLIRRVWRIAPDAATVRFDNLITGASMLRGVKPEATVEIDGVEWDVGGLAGQPEYAYLKPEWLEHMTAPAHAFHFVRYEVGATAAPFAWKPATAPWPPPGAALTLRFAQGALEVAVHYEMYDAIPLMAKWIEVRNGSGKEIALNRFASELLAVVDSEATVDHPPVAPDVLHVETDFAFNGMDARSANRAVEWVPDPQYSSLFTSELEGTQIQRKFPRCG